MHNTCESIHRLPVEQQVQADQVGLAQLARLVVEAGIARGDGLEGIVEVATELCQRQGVPARSFSIQISDIVLRAARAAVANG